MATLRCVIPALAAVVSLVAPASAALAAPAGGSFAGPVTLAGDSKTARYRLDRIEVAAKRVTVRLTLQNTGATTLSFSCPAKAQAASAEVVTDAAGKSRTATDSYCQQHPSKKVQVKAGAGFAVTGTFPAGGWTKGRFTLFWYGATSGTLALDGNRITQVEPPAADSSDGIDWNLWGSFGVLAILLGIAAIWVRALFRRGRFLLSVGAAGAAWYFGIREPWGLLSIATIAVVPAVLLQSRYRPSGGGWAGSSGGGGGGLRGTTGGPEVGWSSDQGPSDSGSGWSPDQRRSEPEEQPVDRGLYGGGPQQGTSRPADEPGSIWGNGPQQGTSTPFTEPGGFYSDRPFGS